MDDTERENGILSMIRAMNHCWTDGWDEQGFAQYIRADAVAIVPTSPGRLVGRDAYVAGWRDFSTAAEIHSWVESGHLVRLYAGGKCAVVTYLFSIKFTLGGVMQEMKGRDMFTLVRSGRKWQVAADQFSPEPPALPTNPAV